MAISIIASWSLNIEHTMLKIAAGGGRGRQSLSVTQLASIGRTVACHNQYVYSYQSSPSVN